MICLEKKTASSPEKDNEYRIGKIIRLQVPEGEGENENKEYIIWDQTEFRTDGAGNSGA
jgi:hypothetical protein